jgi:hypothetical protein
MVDKFTSSPQYEGVWKSEGKFHTFLASVLDGSEKGKAPKKFRRC